MIKNKKLPALTLIEIIIVMSVFMTLMAATVPALGQQLFANQLEVGSQELVHALRKAQYQAAIQWQNDDWGIDIDSGAGTYTFFKGGSFNQRDTAFDINYELPDAITFGSISVGQDQVIFDQITGETSDSGTIQLLGVNNETRTITIEPFGNVQSN